MENTFTPKGMELVQQAVLADNNDDLEAAFSLYKQGINYFMTGLKYTKNEKSKAAIREKIGEYMDRAEMLKKVIDQRAKGGKNVVSGSSGAVVKRRGEDESDDEEDDDGKDPEAAKLRASLAGAIVSKKPNVKWSDVAGLDQAKSLLQEAVILPIKFPQLFTGKREPWKGILLYGPPGTGKSYLAKALATESDSHFLSVSSSDLVSKFQGESERLVKSMFEMAREQQPTIVFIDEIDSLVSARSDGENESARRIKTEFLVQMDGVGKSSKGVLVLGATNTPWDLDPAIRRRFQKRVYIPLPDEVARKAMFKIHIGNTPNSLEDKDLKDLAKATDGYSGSDLANVVRDALYEPVRICQNATHFKKVLDPTGAQDFLYEPCSPGDAKGEEMSLMQVDPEKLKPVDLCAAHFFAALQNAKPSVGDADLKRCADWTTQFGQEG